MKIPINVKYGKEKIKGRIGKSWNDYTFKEFITYLKSVEEGKKEDIYQALTGVSSEMWAKPHKAELFANVDRVLAFANGLPACELPTHIERDGVFYEVNDDFLTLKLSDYVDMMDLINQVQAKEDAKDWEKVEVMSKVIAVIACKNYKNLAEIEQIAAQIDQMPCDVVYTIGSFFFQKLTGLNLGTESKTVTVKDYLRAMPKRVLVRSLAILVICIHYITSPKATLLKVGRYLKCLWVKFTGGDNYRIVSMNQSLGIKNFNK